MSTRVVKHADRRPGRPNRRDVPDIEFEIDQRAFAAADPVALHGANFFRPAFELVEIAQQFVGILRDPQKPLLQLALLDERIFVAPAAAVDNLLVGQHGAHFGHQFTLLFLRYASPFS